jgi:hypothetical protein
MALFSMGRGHFGWEKEVSEDASHSGTCVKDQGSLFQVQFHSEAKGVDLTYMHYQAHLIQHRRGHQKVTQGTPLSCDHSRPQEWFCDTLSRGVPILKQLPITGKEQADTLTAGKKRIREKG